MEFSRVYLIGFMGAGKTTIGRRLARKLGWKFIDLDREIEQRDGRKIADIFRESGEPHFRDLEHAQLKKISCADRAVIALGGGAYIETPNRTLANETGLTVWLKVSFNKVAER